MGRATEGLPPSAACPPWALNVELCLLWCNADPMPPIVVLWSVAAACLGSAMSGKATAQPSRTPEQPQHARCNQRLLNFWFIVELAHKEWCQGRNPVQI